MRLRASLVPLAICPGLTLCATGTRVVSYTHDMGDWQPASQLQIRGRPVYLWTISAVRP